MNADKVREASEGLETCPHCGSEDLMGVLRCGSPEPGDSTDGLGEFQVCETCGWERRVETTEI